MQYLFEKIKIKNILLCIKVQSRLFLLLKMGNYIMYVYILIMRTNYAILTRLT